jgi:type II secretion system protein G
MKRDTHLKLADAISRQAFTLVELLVVIAIIGLLSSVAVASMTTARSKARDTKRLADFKQFKTALEIYYNDNSAYPTCGQACATYCDCSTVGYGASFQSMEIKPSYMANVPNDPINDATYGYFYARGYKPASNCSWTLTSSPSNYIMGLRLENPNGVSGSCPSGFTAWGRTQNFLVGI